MTRFILLSVLAISLACNFSFANTSMQLDTVPRGATTRLGFDLGWEFPYSAGMELAVTIAEAIEINAGVGLGLSGAKAGVGLRAYPLVRSKWSPMIGAHLFTTSGLGEVTITKNTREALYKIPSAKGFLVNVGARCRFKNGDYFLVAMGRSISFNDNKSIYLEGSPDSDIKDIADIMGVGGFSFNLTYLIKLGK